jgi:prevent-host-death family protein
MQTIGVRELKERTSEIVRQVREQRTTFDVTYRGRVVARLTPVEQTADDIAESLRLLDGIELLAAEIDASIQGEVDAAALVRDMRREL